MKTIIFRLLFMTVNYTEIVRRYILTISCMLVLLASEIIDLWNQVALPTFVRAFNMQRADRLTKRD